MVQSRRKPRARLQMQDQLSRLTKAMTFGVILLFLGAPFAYSQNCPSGSTTNFTFAPASLGATMTVTIDLAPCETFELHESHDMLGDGNRGTLVRVTYLNSSDVPIWSQSIYGFDAATDNKVPDSY